MIYYFGIVPIYFFHFWLISRFYFGFQILLLSRYFFNGLRSTDCFIFQGLLSKCNLLVQRNKDFVWDCNCGFSVLFSLWVPWLIALVFVVLVYVHVLLLIL